MNRWLLIGSMAALLIGSTGCMCGSCGLGLRGGCSSGSCSSGSCGDTGCNSCSSNACSSCGDSGCGGACGGGVLGRVGGHVRGKLAAAACGCGTSGCRGGCQAGGLGWQQGGLDYSSHLQPGLLGHNAAANLNSRPFTPGPPSAQVGYPYYTHHGPRDFLMANPPSIGR